MSAPRAAVLAAIEALATARAPGASVTLEELADALAPAAATHDEIGLAIDALEARGHAVDRAYPGSAAEHLRGVLAAARVLTPSLGRAPTPDEVAAHTGLPRGAVFQALALARVLAR